MYALAATFYRRANLCVKLAIFYDSQCRCYICVVDFASFNLLIIIIKKAILGFKPDCIERDSLFFF